MPARPRVAAAPSLAAGFVRSAHAAPERIALEVSGQILSYAALGSRVAALAEAIRQADAGDPALVAVLGQRAAGAYAGILGTLVAGRGYVPLNPRHPAARTHRALALSGARVLIVAGDPAAAEEVLRGAPWPLTVILPDGELPAGLAAEHPAHRFIGAGGLPRDAHLAEPLVDPAATAYLLFTSGSTGEPKGVPVSHANAHAYVETMARRCGFDAEDRFSQMSDLSFDWSINDLFPCWAAGGALCVVPEGATFAPAHFIRAARVTAWAAVPSVVTFLTRMGALRPGSLPTVRRSLFCGEPLLVGQAQAWQAAAPASVVENLYGPTEATVAITGYRWNADRSPGECEHGVVPIGWPFPGQQVRVAADGEGGPGELWLGGSQVTAGYWKDPVRTAERFECRDGVWWYRTGDLVRERPDGCLIYVGRVDHQVKIHGHRVELQEIEGVVRRAARTEQVAAIAWPLRNGAAEGVVAFVAGARPGEGTDREVERACRLALPEYMVPRRTVLLPDLPLNPNGKVDRAGLTRMLEEEVP